MALREKEAVRIKHGRTTNHEEVEIDVGGMTGVVDDLEGYTNERTGEHMVGVKVDSGGGLAFVAENRLAKGSSVSVGFFDVPQERWDDIFGKKAKP